MTGTRLTFDARSNAQIEAHLARLTAAAATHFESVRREIGEYMLGQIQDRFDEQRLWDGSPMPQSKAAIARGGKTLIHVHHLYDSYVYQLPPTGTEVGSNSAYAAAMHWGLPARTLSAKPGKALKTPYGFFKRVNLPAIPGRPVLGVNEQDEQVIGQLLIDEITRLQ